MSLKITDVLSRFGGESDVSIWIRQAHLAKDLLKLDDLAVIIPLFLDGSAFAVYDQLSTEDKKSSSRIEAALKTAFAVDKFNAYEEFRTRMWKPGETVDVFLADLKRLCKLADIGDNEEILKLAFVMGLPRQISGQLRATPKLDTLNLPAILEITRALMADITKGSTAKGVFGAAARSSGSKGSKIVKCFGCGGPHYRKDCPRGKPVVCCSCNKPGHIARHCNNSGNERGGLPAPATAPEDQMAQSYHA